MHLLRFENKSQVSEAEAQIPIDVIVLVLVGSNGDTPVQEEIRSGGGKQGCDAMRLTGAWGRIHAVGV